MSTSKLVAQPRPASGSSAARRLRAEGRVPGVVYGGGQPAETITFARADLRHALNTEAGRNALIRLEFDGQSFLTLPQIGRAHV